MSERMQAQRSQSQQTSNLDPVSQQASRASAKIKGQDYGITDAMRDPYSVASDPKKGGFDFTHLIPTSSPNQENGATGNNLEEKSQKPQAEGLRKTEPTTLHEVTEEPPLHEKSLAEPKNIDDNNLAFKIAQQDSSEEEEFTVFAHESYDNADIYRRDVYSQIYQITDTEAQRLIDAHPDVDWVTSPREQFLERDDFREMSFTTPNYQSFRAFLLGIDEEDFNVPTEDNPHADFREPTTFAEDEDYVESNLEDILSQLSNTFSFNGEISKRYFQQTGETLQLGTRPRRHFNENYSDKVKIYHRIVAGLLREYRALTALPSSVQELLGTNQKFLEFAEYYTQLLRIGNLLNQLPTGYIDDFDPISSYEIEALENYESLVRDRLKNVEGAVEEFPQMEGYWIPSTGTLNQMNIQERLEFFLRLLNPNRQPLVKKIYLDVLAPAGATVQNNTLAETDYLGVNQDILTELQEAAEMLGRTDVEIVPWIEGSGLTLPSENKDSLYGIAKQTDNENQDNQNQDNQSQDNQNQDNQNQDDPNPTQKELLEQLEQGGAILADKFPDDLDLYVPYVDVLDDDVFKKLQNFMIEVAQRNGVREIIIDDNFGINESQIDNVIEKYTALGEFQIDLNEIKGEQEKKDAKRQWIADRLTEKMVILQAVLEEENVRLSVSINTKFRNAFDDNCQEIETWIDKGIINGTLNFQIYRPTLQAFIAEYKLMKGEINDYLTKKYRNDKNYDINKFPTVTVSVAREGVDWELGLGETDERKDPGDPESELLKGYEVIAAQINYVNDNKVIMYKDGEEKDQKIEVQEVVGFDARDYENLKDAYLEQLSQGLSQN